MEATLRFLLRHKHLHPETSPNKKDENIFKITTPFLAWGAAKKQKSEVWGLITEPVLAEDSPFAAGQTTLLFTAAAKWAEAAEDGADWARNAAGKKTEVVTLNIPLIYKRVDTHLCFSWRLCAQT